jgi:hypothetical protein
MGTGVLSAGFSGPDVMLTTPSSAEVRNEWSYASTPLICLRNVDRDNFTILLYLLSVLEFV